MIVAMEAEATEEQINHVCDRIREFGYTPHVLRGTERTVVAAVGPGDKKEHIEEIKSADGVENAFPILHPFKLVSKEVKKQKSSIAVGDVTIGDGGFVVMAGPCSVEGYEQLITTADSVVASGAQILRGGAYKPRTSPYDFQGMAEEGLKLLAEARKRTGLKVITEVLDTEDVELVAEYADILQVGARNMQNFALLKKLGEVSRPIMLKRGLAATIKEFLLSAEYIVTHGNPNVILCERGIRTFETATRNTLDIAAVPLLNELTHLPVIVDPSHATGKRSLVQPLAKATVAVGADGLMVEVHPTPEQAWSDGPQSLRLEEFAKMMDDLQPYINLRQNENIHSMEHR
ncbi:MAG: 3-deoxy-7-phosphoheptulonate synthase [Blastocatellia bacterium]|nr:3-deoxy-7-phosphoheptulonate synthase [Blastocatellia bacterium]